MTQTLGEVIAFWKTEDAVLEFDGEAFLLVRQHVAMSLHSRAVKPPRFQVSRNLFLPGSAFR
jgi:hypothetical protein